MSASGNNEKTAERYTLERRPPSNPSRPSKMKIKKKAVRKDKPALYIRNTVDEKTGLMTLSKNIDNTCYI